MKPTKLTKTQIQNTVTNAIKDAVDFIESKVAPARIKSQRYVDGKVDISHEDGRSKVVATKCRDTLRAVKPSLMRVFLQSDNAVEFIPRTPQAAIEAEQKTNYAQYIFDKNNGFMLLSDAFDDALKKKCGILKAYHQEETDAEIEEYTGLSEDQVALVLMDPDVEVIEQEVEVEGVIDEMGVTIQPPIYELKVSRTSRRGEIKIDAIAPEDFFVDRRARSIKDCYVCGHKSDARVGDLVAMGFDFDEVYKLSGEVETSTQEAETLYRTGMSGSSDDELNDPSMRHVLFTEAYMRMDIDGIGIPKLYKFICAGENYTILDRELADVNPFAVFEVDPEAHTFFGRSLIEIIIDDQDASTALLRGLLDNISLINNPRLVVGHGINQEDLLNNEIGGFIRAEDINQVRELVVGGAASAILPAMAYYDETIRGKTGVSGAGMGLDADVLQSQTAMGVNAAVQAANQVSELIARHLAEGGMKQLFQIIAQLARQNPNPEEMMRVNGQFMPVDPRSWSADATMTVNVGLGTSRKDERSMVLRETLQTQMGIWQAYGPSNGIVTMTNIRATLADILKISGLYNSDRYYNPIDQQTEQALMMQAQQAAQGQAPQGDPNAAFLQAEQMKTSARVQADLQKTALDAKRLQMEDDRARDQMAQDLAIKVAEILAKTGVQLNTQSLKIEQAMPRPMQPQIGGMMPNV